MNRSHLSSNKVPFGKQGYQLRKLQQENHRLKIKLWEAEQDYYMLMNQFRCPVELDRGDIKLFSHEPQKVYIESAELSPVPVEFPSVDRLIEILHEGYDDFWKDNPYSRGPQLNLYIYGSGIHDPLNQYVNIRISVRNDKVYFEKEGTVVHSFNEALLIMFLGQCVWKWNLWENYENR